MLSQVVTQKICFQKNFFVANIKGAAAHAGCGVCAQAAGRIAVVHDVHDVLDVHDVRADARHPWLKCARDWQM